MKRLNRGDAARQSWRAYLTISRLRQACSYCVCPTREARSAAAQVMRSCKKSGNSGPGLFEVQLLGQTVNSYTDPSQEDAFLGVAAGRR